MGYAYRTHTYTSGPQEFPVNFTLGYISKQDVFVSVVGEVDGEGAQVYRSFNWIDDNTISVEGDLENGDVVKIQRVVSKQELAVDFASTGTATRDNLNAGFKQLLMAVHELYDGVLADRALVTALPQDIENGLAFISNNASALLAAASLDNVTLQELSDVYVDVATALADAQTAETNAETAETNAETALASCQALLTQMNALAASITTSAPVLKFYGLKLSADCDLLLDFGIESYDATEYLWWDVNSDAITFSIDNNGHLLLQEAT